MNAELADIFDLLDDDAFLLVDELADLEARPSALAPATSPASFLVRVPNLRLPYLTRREREANSKQRPGTHRRLVAQIRNRPGPFPRPRLSSPRPFRRQHIRRSSAASTPTTLSRVLCASRPNAAQLIVTSCRIVQTAFRLCSFALSGQPMLSHLHRSCIEAPADPSSAELIGDPGKKNGAKRLRKCIIRCPYWQDADYRRRTVRKPKKRSRRVCGRPVPSRACSCQQG